MREREEKKRERAINEINDRQMGKLLKSSANIDICSTKQFPDYSNMNEMPALTSNANESQSSSPKGLPSFANVIYATYIEKRRKMKKNFLVCAVTK